MTREQEFFWQQYDGLVKAIDLPADYKKSDVRIYCVNKECGTKEKCLFWQRFMQTCKTFGQSHFKMMCKAVKQDQRGYERPYWDKNYPRKDYRNASFGFLPDHDGYGPCNHFTESDNKD